ncbi:MAG: hypothetical protein J0H02_17100 [Armatimonadetes bacterium]|nr:hypothetical protein [Armatimonadota bacterium]
MSIALAFMAVVSSAWITPHRSEEGKSPESVIAAVYDVISGPAGQKRDWERMRSLFAPNATLTAIGKGRDGKVRRQVLTVEDYIKLSGPYLEEKGFFETEIASRSEKFRDLVHVWSTYESRSKKEDKPFARGINSFQLWNDGTRWYVLSIVWQEEDAQNPIPEKYVGKG